MFTKLWILHVDFELLFTITTKFEFSLFQFVNYIGESYLHAVLFLNYKTQVFWTLKYWLYNLKYYWFKIKSTHLYCILLFRKISYKTIMFIGGNELPKLGCHNSLSYNNLKSKFVLLLHLKNSKEALIIHCMIIFCILAKKFKVIKHKFSNKRIAISVFRWLYTNVVGLPISTGLRIWKIFDLVRFQ